MDDLELAAALVTEAGQLAATMLRDGLPTEYKTSVSDVVSAADHAAEELIADRLSVERPHDGLVGEEGGQRGSGARTWYVDPVDGTYNFLSGLPIWCSAIALADTGGPPANEGVAGGGGLVLGAIYQPSTDELWLGGREHPTTCNSSAVPPLPDRPLAELSIASYLHPTTLSDDTARVPFLRVVAHAATVRMLGSGSVELAAVAAGRLGASVQLDSAPWDWLPGAALVAAAGGTTTVAEANGHRWHLAGNRQAVDELADLVRDRSVTLAVRGVAPA